jgi:hypothetical protein
MVNGQLFAYETGRTTSTQTTCAVIWTAAFGGRVASNFSSLGLLNKSFLQELNIWGLR